jgi:hypothetical protein
MNKITKYIIYLIVLCALISWAVTSPDADAVKDIRQYIQDGVRVIANFLEKPIAVMSNWPRALIIILLWIPLFFAYLELRKFNDKVSEKIDALTGAGFDLVRLMENTTDGTAKKAGFLDDTAYRFAVTGPAVIAGAFNGPATAGTASRSGSGSGFVNSNVISLPPDMAQCAQETAHKMMQRRLDDMTSFSGSMTNVRNGLAVYLALMQHKNVQSAFLNMIEHMKKQRDDEKKKTTNFTELKLFFGLPTEYPEGDMPEKLQKAGISTFERKAIIEALKTGREKALKDLVYNPPVKDDNPPIAIKGENVLKAMRTFMYKADTYDPSLSSTSQGSGWFSKISQFFGGRPQTKPT